MHKVQRCFLLRRQTNTFLLHQTNHPQLSLWEVLVNGRSADTAAKTSSLAKFQANEISLLKKHCRDLRHQLVHEKRENAVLLKSQALFKEKIGSLTEELACQNEVHKRFVAEMKASLNALEASNISRQQAAFKEAHAENLDILGELLANIKEAALQLNDTQDTPSADICEQEAKGTQKTKGT